MSTVSLRTAVRINPVDFEEESLSIDDEIHEVCIKPNYENDDETQIDSWIVDDVLDSYSQRTKQIQFSSQSCVYDTFHDWITSEDVSNYTCLIVGGRASGKSNCLFGDGTNENQGILPRFVNNIFHSGQNDGEDVFIQCSMYMAFADQCADLFDPPRFYPYDNNIALSLSLGVTVLPIRVFTGTSSDDVLQVLHLGVLSASMLALNTDHCYNPGHIVINLRVVRPSRVYTITFIEASAMIFLPLSITESDRLSSRCWEINAGNALCQCGLQGGGVVDVFNQRRGKSARSPSAPYEHSFLTYLLQDTFMLRGAQPVSASRSQSCLLIGCLRGMHSCSSDNKATLDLLQTVSEKVQGVNNQLRKSMTTADVQTTESVTSMNQGPAPAPTTQELLSSLQQEKEFIGDLMQSFAQTRETTNCESHAMHMSFYKRKEAYIASVQRQLEHPSNSHYESLFLIPAIQNWLKLRGVIGIKVRKVELRRTDAEVAAMLLRKQESEEEVSDPVPWSMNKVTPDDPFLCPISSLGFCSQFLFLPIPGGHTAVCYKSLESDVLPGEEVEEEGEKKEGNVKLSFPGIKHCKIVCLDGFDVFEKHCVFFRLGSTVKVRPFHDDDGVPAPVRVNGHKISVETVLHDCDVLRLGVGAMFVVRIPGDQSANENGAEPTVDYDVDREVILSEDLEDLYQQGCLDRNVLVENSNLKRGYWDKAVCVCMQESVLNIVSSSIASLNHKKHSALEREIISISKVSELTDDMMLAAYAPPLPHVHSFFSQLSPNVRACICETLLATMYVNCWSHEMKRYVRCEARIVEFPREKGGHLSTFVPRQYRGLEDGFIVDGKRYRLVVHVEVLDQGSCTSRGDSWIWSPTIFMQRYFQMRKMYDCFKKKCDGDLDTLDDVYPSALDPFLDPSDAELIGVCMLHLDSLFYLMDTRDTMPIISFKGIRAGSLKMTLRSWIDEVETVPSYISIDKESKLSDFPGQNCIMRFYFESLHDINPQLSSDVQVVFSFFCHSGQYRTSRHPARNMDDGDIHPFINSTVVIEQKITPDFIRYVQKKTIEFEIWGSRITNRKYTEVQKGDVSTQRIGEPACKVAQPMGKSIIGDTSARVDNNGALEADEEGDYFDEDDSPAVGSDPVELRAKLKEMALLLERAERDVKRTSRAAASFREEISKTNSRTTYKELMAEKMIEEKDKKILEMEAELAELKSRTAEMERQEAVNKEKNSRICC
eukprot:CAMPEP_0185022732 /NCGR_PEP_ID=MMETSP1103-20130426/5438_1 /TAXON_ID=36769 /ORGANISM="Paraphysomonas bandaiensis, Strain Caron Lab Isolate" /LENGTH=1220 /DNA_ID=CAMNT_0027554947 /DNA_START=140 /DNA_END=3799 /DNA_ORIENTATION=-